ncbi:hypothetical protein HDF24_15205 [Mucilaginibacter sp. X4EP1]|uniref:hypothetical protein n=1 Tax=Mucilaginibacter sp. X4EP1 TaxID=2723092 RepID=UPI0021692D48|nr:hypothetical protein [Mucilaginibacter sp. X4EP1]MCS3815354.1 hypothetical protein [Mucilaginibacter sp. X4EP1]
MATFDRDELIGKLYADNLFLKAQTKLLLHLIMTVASKSNCGFDASAIIDVYNSKIQEYYEDQQLLSPFRDEILEAASENFLKQLKDQLKSGDQEG